jgi:hypothetical protein
MPTTQEIAKTQIVNGGNGPKKLRQAVSGTGSFISLPDAFPKADEAVKYAPKIELQVGRFDDATHPSKADFFMLPHHLLVDLEAVDHQAFDFKKLAQDCDILKAVAQSNAEDLRTMLAAFSADAPHDRILDADKIARRLRLDEAQVSERGGGMILLLIAVACILLSCGKGCAHTNYAMRQQ